MTQFPHQQLLSTPRLRTISSLYLDESGSRHPDRVPHQNRPQFDWFSIGGILIDDEMKAQAKSDIASFRAKWPQIQDKPLHSHEIRGGYKNFVWLQHEPWLKQTFLDELTHLLVGLPVIGFACVIDRPGHNSRYKDKYAGGRWLLCKTAFAIVVERAVKHCIDRNRSLRINIERSGKSEERALRDYYRELKNSGHWFNASNSAKYEPISASQFQSCLYDFKVKTKSSLLMTIADLYLWPMCIGGYHQKNLAYTALRQAGKLIDDHVSTEEIAALGIKYSCFETVTRQTERTNKNAE